MRKVVLISFALLVASLAGQGWVRGQQQAPPQGRGGQGQGQGGGQRGPAYQGKPMPPNMEGTYTMIPNATLQTVMAQTGGDTPVRVTDSPSGHYGVSIITHQPQAPQPGAPVNGTYHTDVTEIYYVIDGTGSVALGGGLDNAKEMDPEGRGVKTVTGPSASGAMSNFTVVSFSPGAVFIVPPGVPHQVAYDIITKTDFLVVRIDPKKTLDLK